MSTIVAQICIRRDTAANFTSANPTLALGEIAYETDTRNIKVGDGATAWTALPYINPYRGGTAAAPTSNTVLGSGAGAVMQSGAEDNVLIGLNAGNNITTADGNVFIGKDVGNQTTGSNSVAIGWEAMASSGSAAFNSVAVGYRSLWQATGGNNVAVGLSAASASGSFSGVTAVGAGAATLNTANDITAVGANALDANTTGTLNTAVGKDALGANTTGGSNTAVGNNALSSASTTSGNTAIGTNAGRLFTGDRSVFVGSQAGDVTTTNGSQTFVGDRAGIVNTGSSNTYVGSRVGPAATTGSSNVGVGSYVFGALTTGSNNIAIGGGLEGAANGANQTTSTGSNTICIGYGANPAAAANTNEIVIGTSVTGNGSNTTTIGNSSTTGTFIPAGNLTLTNGNFIVGTSGKGIDFSATAHAGGMTSELLSDYEEGTWTPVYAPATGSFTTLTMDVIGAKYVKVGSQVTVTAMLRTDNVDATGASGGLRVSGLPFSTSSVGRGSGGASIAFAWGGDYPQGVLVAESRTYLDLHYRDAVDGTDVLLDVSDMVTGAVANQNTVYLTCTYMA